MDNGKCADNSLSERVVLRIVAAVAVKLIKDAKPTHSSCGFPVDARMPKSGMPRRKIEEKAPFSDFGERGFIVFYDRFLPRTQAVLPSGRRQFFG